MTATILLVAAAAIAAGPDDRARLYRLGGDPAAGILINRSPRARPFDRLDPSLPTVVFVHGFNPAPRTFRYLMGERLAESIARRGGPPVNILEWGWNAASFVSVRMSENQENSIAQGRLLAAALWASGAAPGKVHFVGQSSGAIVVASAARTFVDCYRQPVAQVTLLDPATHYHDVVFQQLAVGTAAARVENYWSPGPGAYGRPAGVARVSNIRADVPAPLSGAVLLSRSAHLNVFRYYLATVEDRSCSVGYNVSMTCVAVQ
jgi:hypothetical protein